jgi:hypothetical protein
MMGQFVLLERRASATVHGKQHRRKSRASTPNE